MLSMRKGLNSNNKIHQLVFKLRIARLIKEDRKVVKRELREANKELKTLVKEGVLQEFDVERLTRKIGMLIYQLEGVLP